MRILAVCLLPLVVLACAGIEPASVTNPPVGRDGGWQIGSLQAAGFDGEKMQQLESKLQSGGHPNAHAVLVEHAGKLVFETYLAGEDRSMGESLGYREFDLASLHDLRSISKSVTSLLLGIALAEDFETALSRPIIEYFPELAGEAASGVDRITLHQVLTMSTGQQWNEMEVPYSSRDNDEIRLYYQPDPLPYVLGKPVLRIPGEDWYYNGGTTMLLAEIIVRVSGMEFLDFAQQALFDPLGIEPANVEWRGLGFWWQRPRLPSAMSGLRLRARDLAKIGSLVLHQGRWANRQVVPRAWVRVSSQRHMEQTFPIWSNDGVYGYGYQWWHGRFSGDFGELTALTGVGYGGQRLFVIPGRDIVVTIFAGNYGSGHYRVSEAILAEVVAAAPRQQ